MLVFFFLIPRRQQEVRIINRVGMLCFVEPTLYTLQSMLFSGLFFFFIKHFWKQEAWVLLLFITDTSSLPPPPLSSPPCLVTYPTLRQVQTLTVKLPSSLHDGVYDKGCKLMKLLLQPVKECWVHTPHINHTFNLQYSADCALISTLK